jgi:hypothetical protein
VVSRRNSIHGHSAPWTWPPTFKFQK